MILDASVAAKWFVDEPLSAEARALKGNELQAPDLLVAEVANVLWKKVRRGEGRADAAAAAVRSLRSGPVRLRPGAPLVGPALELAFRLGHPVYDCIYLALADREGDRVETCDGGLVEAAEAGGLGHLVHRVGDAT